MMRTFSFCFRFRGPWGLGSHRPRGWAALVVALPFWLGGTALHAQAQALVPATCAGTTPPPPPTRLIDLLDEALCADARTRLAWQQIQLQSARLDGQLASERPELALRLETGRESGALAPGNGRSRTATLELGWLLLDGGRQEAATRAARLAVTEAMAQRDTAFQSVLLDTAQAHHAVLDAQQAVQVRQTWQDALAAMQPDLQRRHRSGRAEHTALLELRQARTRAQIGVREARLALAVARSRLSALTGRAADTAWPALADTAPPEPDLTALTAKDGIERSLAQAIEQHPELAAAQARVGVARAALDQAARAGRPTLGLSHSLGRGRRTGDTADGSPVSGSARQTTLALTWPLFDGGVRQAQTQAARVEHDTARTTLEDQRQRLAAGVWEAYQEWHTAAAVQAEYQDLTRLARGLLVAETTRYEDAGEDASLSDVLSARQDWTDALIEQQQAHSRQRLSGWRLAASLGRLQRGSLRGADDSSGVAPLPLPLLTSPAPQPVRHPPAKGCQPGTLGHRDAWCVPR